MAAQIVMLGLLALLGYFVGKTGYLPENSGIILSKIVIKITAPILVFFTMAGKSFTRHEIQDGFLIYIFAFVFLLLSFAVGVVLSGRFKFEDSTKNIFLMHFMFGNVAFLAFPLIKSVFGNEWLVNAVFFNLANDTLLWTLGIYLVTKHNNADWRKNLKHLINGNTIAFSLGIVCIIINLQKIVNNSMIAKNIYDMIYNTFNPLGESTIPLSMLFIGLILSETQIGSFKDILKRYPSFVISFLKLMVIPLVTFFILNLFGNSISPIVKGIVVLQLAMPCGTIVPALAAQYDSDYRFATENVFVSTMLCVITLPLVSLIVK